MTAMGRLERALSRIESLQHTLPALPLGLADDHVSAVVHRRLHDRNALLRRQVESAVRRIDRLLAEDGPG